MVKICHTAKSTSEAAQETLGRLLSSGDEMHQISIRMPLGLFEELSRQAAERGLPVAGYIRSQLAHSIRNPSNIHKTTKARNVSTEVV